MPTGFDVETGISLSPRLAEFVDTLASWLKAKRDTDEVTPQNPATASRIESWAIQHHHTKLSDSDIRAMMNYLRRTRRPIASVAGGYFWAVNHGELRSTLEHLHQRIGAMAQAADGLKYADFGEPRLL